MDFAHIPDRIPMLLTAGELRALIDAEIAEANRQLASIQKSYDGLKKAFDAVDALLNYPPSADYFVEEVKKLVADQTKLKDLTFAYDVLSTDSGALLAENKRLSRLVESLEAMLPGPDTPPVVVPVPEVPEPVEDMKQPDFRPGHLRFIGARIVKDDTPGETQNANVRLNLDICQDIGVDLWGGLLNFQEVRDHQAALKAGDRVKNLVAYGEDRGIAFAADTIDAMVYDKGVNVYRGDTILKPYFDGLVSLGTKFLIVNDAHQYRARKPDNTPIYPDGTLERIVGIIRRLCPLPIMGSLSANDDPADYPMFDFHEVQTFGKSGQLEGFFSQPFDVYIIPTRARESVDYHIAARPQILKRNPRAVFLFAALERGGTNFVNMHDQVTEITKTVQQLRAQQGR